MQIAYNQPTLQGLSMSSSTHLSSALALNAKNIIPACSCEYFISM